MSNETDFVQSPCIGHCTLDDGDICVGCFRHIDEITGWHGADNQRRTTILERCQRRKTQRSNQLPSN